MKLDSEIITKILNTVDSGLCRGVGYPEPGKMCVEAAVCFALGLPHSDNPGCVAVPVRALKIQLNDADWSSCSARAAGLRRLAIAQLGTSEDFDELFFAKWVFETAKRFVDGCKIESDDVTEAGDLMQRANVAIFAAQHLAYSDSSASESAIQSVRAVLLVRESIVCMLNDEVKLSEEHAEELRKEAERADESADVEYPEDDELNRAATQAHNTYLSSYWRTQAAEKAIYDASDRFLCNFAEEIVGILIQMRTPGSEWLHLTEAPKV